MADPVDPNRRPARRAGRRQRLLWLGVATFLLLLLSIFSGGFFLYATLVVLGLAVLSTATASMSFLGLEVERFLPQDEIELGDAVDVELVLHNRKELPAFWLFWQEQIEPGLDLEGPASACRFVPSGTSSRLRYRLHSLRRGLFRVGPAVIESSGPFGLVRRFRVDGSTSFVTVLPRSLAIGQGWPLGHRPIHEVPRRRSLFEDPSRFLGIREYRRGDPLRRVHWRATARSARLQVKLYEPSVLEGVLLAVEMGEAAYPESRRHPDSGDPIEELTITAATSLADFALRGDQAVGLLSNGGDAAERYPDDWTGGRFRRLDEALEETRTRRRLTGYRPLEVPPAKARWQRDRLRTALARLTPAPGMTLPELLHVETPRLPRSLVLAVLTPTVDDALLGVLPALRHSGIEVAVVWIGARPEAIGSVALPRDVPVYPVAGEKDLETLGAARL